MTHRRRVLVPWARVLGVDRALRGSILQCSIEPRRPSAYFRLARRRTIYFLWIYGKHAQNTLSSQQKAVLRALAGRIRAEAGEP